MKRLSCLLQSESEGKSAFAAEVTEGNERDSMPNVIFFSGYVAPSSPTKTKFKARKTTYAIVLILASGNERRAVMAGGGG